MNLLGHLLYEYQFVLPKPKLFVILSSPGTVLFISIPRSPIPVQGYGRPKKASPNPNSRAHRPPRPGEVDMLD